MWMFVKVRIDACIAYLGTSSDNLNGHGDGYCGHGSISTVCVAILVASIGMFEQGRLNLSQTEPLVIVSSVPRGHPCAR
jgi:hypothetical protein